MRNPFEELSRAKPEPPEEVGGSFACQEKGCYECVTVARYLAGVEVLTWECPAGHINKIEGFKFND